VPASLKYLERVWGSVEILKFIIVTVVASNIIAFGLNWIEYMVLGKELFLYVLPAFTSRFIPVLPLRQCYAIPRPNGFANWTLGRVHPAYP
jgi:hypothetical protein